jgi:hypothetical protein
MSEPISWHRLFGLSLVDFFRGLPVSVELEKDLSMKQQLLDVVLIRKEAGPLPCRLPDGFEDLAAHNLVTFKSYQEALDGWALNELIGHYVNYRKQASPSMQDLLPETDFRLFAVSVRFPQSLARQVALARVQPGVYEVRHFTGVIRLWWCMSCPSRNTTPCCTCSAPGRTCCGTGPSTINCGRKRRVRWCCNCSRGIAWR